MVCVCSVPLGVLAGLQFLTGLYGMNFEVLPELTWKYRCRALRSWDSFPPLVPLLPLARALGTMCTLAGVFTVAAHPHKLTHPTVSAFGSNFGIVPHPLPVIALQLLDVLARRHFALYFHLLFLQAAGVLLGVGRLPVDTAAQALKPGGQ
jgi:hypothetical protein